MAVLSERDWQIRLAIYEQFVALERPPTPSEIAEHFAMSEHEARSTFKRLQDGHAILLRPNTTDILMANPLSGIPTAFRVTCNKRQLYANCAWDSVGIPAMLHADAEIVGAYSHGDGRHDPARYAISNGELTGDDGLVHFPLPFRNWYDDLVHT